MLSMLALGFASGVPYPLLNDNLQAWMKDAGVSLRDIGAASLVSLPFVLKVFWAPLLDNFSLPLLGRRRGWMLVSSVGLLIALAMMAAMGTRSIFGLMLLATAAAAFSATFDTVADAYRADSLPEHQRASGAAVWVTGYRIAMIALGAGALAISGSYKLSWPMIYIACAGVLAVGWIAILLSPEPKVSGELASDPVLAYVRPVLDLLLRRGGLVVLAFVLLFKIPDYLAARMTMPFLLDIKVPREQIAAIRQAVGMGITILGALVGGGLAPWLGMRRSLLVFGILQAASNFGFVMLAWTGPSKLTLTGVIAAESFCAGLVAAGFTAFLMSQCNPLHSATQFAAMTALMRLVDIGGGYPAGWAAEKLGWSGYFLFTIVTALPGLLLIPLLRQYTPPPADTPERPEPPEPRGVALSRE